MKLQLSKLYAAGHDYLFLRGWQERNGLATLCDRRRGIGADGVLVSEAGMSPDICYYDDTGAPCLPGDAALTCAAKELYDTGACNATEFCVACGGTNTRIRIESCGGAAWGVTRDLGYPNLDAAQIDATLSGLYRSRQHAFEGISHPVTLLTLGGSFAYLHLSPEDAPPASTAALPTQVTPATLVAPGKNLLSVTPLRTCRDEPRLAAGGAVAAAISGAADFCEAVSVACRDATYRVTVTPELHTYVTLEVERIFSGQVSFDIPAAGL